MTDIFESDATWKILTYFIKNPTKESYPRELEKTLKMSSGSTSTVCKKLERKGILELDKRAMSHFYRLKNESFFVRKLKTAWFLNTLGKHKETFAGEEFQAVALYGSYASGEFDEKSDVDILVITNVGKPRVKELFKALENELTAQVSLTILTVAQWKALAEVNDRFYKEVLANHVILYGTSILLG